RRTTNRYFLSKLAAEVELYRSALEAWVFRPSYVVGPRDGLTRDLMDQLAHGLVEVPDGHYRLQPVGVRDAAAAVLGAVEAPAGPGHRVIDLVGPEPIAFADYLPRFAAAVRRQRGEALSFEVARVPIAEADRRAANGGFRGMPPDELDCLLC